MSALHGVAGTLIGSFTCIFNEAFLIMLHFFFCFVFFTYAAAQSRRNASRSTVARMKERASWSSMGQNANPINKTAELRISICAAAGEAMEQGLRDCCRSIRIGKILIQSDEETQKAKVYYAKFPPDVYRRKVLLMYPILSK